MKVFGTNSVERIKQEYSSSELLQFDDLLEEIKKVEVEPRQPPQLEQPDFDEIWSELSVSSKSTLSKTTRLTHGSTQEKDKQAVKKTLRTGRLGSLRPSFFDSPVPSINKNLNRSTVFASTSFSKTKRMGKINLHDTRGSRQSKKTISSSTGAEVSQLFRAVDIQRTKSRETFGTVTQDKNIEEDSVLVKKKKMFGTLKSKLRFSTKRDKRRGSFGKVKQLSSNISRISNKRRESVLDLARLSSKNDSRMSLMSSLGRKKKSLFNSVDSSSGAPPFRLDSPNPRFRKSKKRSTKTTSKSTSTERSEI